MWRWALLFVCSCNQVYGLDRTDPRDAAVIEPPPDMDRDTVADADDNCPKVANTDQANTDGDLRGDVCDDCPLIANEDGLDNDLDGLGDVCDPHPDVAGDCLLVLDTFRDPKVFETHWKVSASDAGSTATAEPGAVVLRPATEVSSVTITELGTSGITDVVVQGTTLDPDALVSAMSSQQTSSEFYGCRLVGPSAMSADGPGVGIPTLQALVPLTPINNKFLLRLITFDTKVSSDPIDLLCRVDYGVAVGTQTKPGQPVLAGPPGIVVAGGASRIDAIAITRAQPGVACPPTVYR